MTLDEFAELVGKELEAKRRLDRIITRNFGADAQLDANKATLAWLRAKARVIHAAMLLDPKLLEEES